MPDPITAGNALAADVLCDALAPGLKDSIRRLVAAGEGKRAIMSAIYRTAGRRSLTTLAAAAWCDRMLKEYA